jgi:multidrug efflux pump subunit AcrB
MPRFAIHKPYLIIVVCLIVTVVGITSLARMPVDLFPNIDIPVVVVATFFSGMPPEQIETDITGRFERFFTLGSNIEHIESRSLPGVSLIKIYFQPGTNADSAVTNISNLAMANLRRLPHGTLPPVVLKFDASSLPVCLITLKGKGLNETQLRDYGQFQVRNQVANVDGASVPQPFGGRYRQIMVYVDPLKLQAFGLSPMDVVRRVNNANLILPAGDVKIGPIDYNIYTNSQIDNIADMNRIPLKTVGARVVTVGDVGVARDAQQIQTSIVRVDGQPSVYLPVLKQGGDTNTISVVEGVRKVISNLMDVPKSLVTHVVFDQSQFVKGAIHTLILASGIGLFLTCVMILIFLSSLRAMIAVTLSVPLSALAAFIALAMGGSSVNSLVLGGLALAFTRMLFNSLVVLENIFRHLEMGEAPQLAAEAGGKEVAIPVIAATLTTVVVFFPVVFLYGVSRFLFSALALAVVLALFASYFVALTVVPLFCSRYLRQRSAEEKAQPGRARRIAASLAMTLLRQWPGRKGRAPGAAPWFKQKLDALLELYTRALEASLRRPAGLLIGLGVLFAASLLLYPRLQIAFFPRIDAGQFVIDLKGPSGTRLEDTEEEVKKVEDVIRRQVAPRDLGVILSNIGVTPGFSSIYTSNSAPHTAFVQVSLKAGHKTGSYEYMHRVRQALREQVPELNTYFQSGGLSDAVLNLGLPAPIDVQVSGSSMHASYATAQQLAAQIRRLPGVEDVFIPQDLDYPALQLAINRTRASELGLSQKEVVSNVITALTSNQMIAPSYWVDPKTGNDYMLTVQYPDNQIQTLEDLKSIPLHAAGQAAVTALDAVAQIHHTEAPTEVDHYQLRRVIDLYVAPSGEGLGKVANQIDRIIARTDLPEGVRVNLRGMVQGMRASFRSFGMGLILAVVLLYLILVAQFRSFVDPFLILVAVPTGITGTLLTLYLTGTTLNVMSLMGVVMMVGIVVSNSILMVEFTQKLRADGMAVREAIVGACRTRFRVIIMTSVATVVGLLPLAVKLGTSGETYVPMARAIIGGVTVSLLASIFAVPAAYFMVYRRRDRAPQFETT